MYRKLYGAEGGGCRMKLGSKLFGQRRIRKRVRGAGGLG